MTADIGVTGLAVMGSNLARNFARHGFTVAVHNRSVEKTNALIAEHGHEGTFLPAASPADFVGSLQRPRRAMIMVQAGGPTDAVIEDLANLMEPGDIIIDGGNSRCEDDPQRHRVRRHAAYRRGV
jgi:6-phosphogluconate dehydrogenase